MQTCDLTAYRPLLENLYNTRLDYIPPEEHELREEFQDMTFDDYANEIREILIEERQIAV